LSVLWERGDRRPGDGRDYGLCLVPPSALGHRPAASWSARRRGAVWLRACVAPGAA